MTGPGLEVAPWCWGFAWDHGGGRGPEIVYGNGMGGLALMSHRGVGLRPGGAEARHVFLIRMWKPGLDVAPWCWGSARDHEVGRGPEIGPNQAFR